MGFSKRKKQPHLFRPGDDYKADHVRDETHVARPPSSGPGAHPESGPAVTSRIGSVGEADAETPRRRGRR